MKIKHAEEPPIIQGGMGIAVSHWELAKAVSQTGQLGVVSGTALNLVFAERLRLGDPGGHMRRAVAAFPFPKIAAEVLQTYLNQNQSVPMFDHRMNPDLLKLTVVANFCEVFLAKENHSGRVGINYLEKVQLPHLPSLYGAMLACVDYVLMGAGIPREIPGVLDKLSQHESASIKLQVENASADDDFRITFNPKEILGFLPGSLKRPKFIAVVSSDALAVNLARKSNGRVDGFVIEAPCAGGHNAPPRGALQLDESEQPIYGPRDEVNLNKVKALGLPFWLAGGWNSPKRLSHALELGACGVQMGTFFAFCQESGLQQTLRHTVLQKVLNDKAVVKTDPVASPTGFPFKVVQLEDTLSEEDVYQKRPRICQLGFLRKPYKRENGSLGYRCPGEPVSIYLEKGGKPEETIGRKCLCNALMTNIGFPQARPDYEERPLITAGNDLNKIKAFLQPNKLDYTAQEVIAYMLTKVLAH